MEKQSNIRREIEGIDEKIKGTKLKVKDLIVPIIVAIILIFVAIFVFIPMLRNAIDLRAELTEIKRKQEQMLSLREAVNGIDEGVMLADLTDAKSVIPKTLKVSNFLYYIDELAYEKNLSSEVISVGDVNVTSPRGEDSASKGDSKYKGVNGPLAYSGKLQDVLSFLDSFYTSSPYIVSPENITLESRGDNRWEVELNLTGYYILEEENVIVNLYKPFKAYTDYSDVVGIFREKALRLAGDTDL
ncbi:TPA: hypothetical protein GX533_00145 [Candidatus Dojkabacteria bacterium]|jgi:hypothetical protein|uniref:Uncharacterized protein n=1 Tax=Candidatus Dojkabacteria bacterium TaxID=2099670 RepID=A0A832QGN0_9BACT|nr:hypothetical protein [Candidatus Dojkabacteria bacterium]